MINGKDSFVFGTNLSEQNLMDDKKYKGTVGGIKTAVKIYYTLTQEEIELYHKIHNIFYEKVNGKEIKLEKPINIEGQEFDKVKVKVLKLKDSFITYAKLKNKIKESLDNYLLGYKPKIVSIQKYIDGKNLKLEIQKKSSKIDKEIESGEINLIYFEDLEQSLLNLVELKSNIISFFDRKYVNYVQYIDYLNIKYIIENGELVVYITDIGGNIEELLKDYKK